MSPHLPDAVVEMKLTESSEKRVDGRSDLQHGMISVVSFRQCLGEKSQSSYATNASCIVERKLSSNSESSLKIFCEIDGPRSQSNSSLVSSPLAVKVTARENETPRWWQKQMIEKAIHSALLPALITPTTGWAATCFDLNFVIELPESGLNRSDVSNLEDELSLLQLITNCVNAGSVALMARGIPVRDLVVGCVCSMKSGNNNKPFRLIVDPSVEEVSDAVVVVAATVMPSLGQFSALWWHTSPKEELRKIAHNSFAQNQSRIVNSLVATAVAVRPLLADALNCCD